jgi:trans-aconitate methyltransferase
VDWKDENSQLIRFTQLAKILDKSGFTVADIGCGYGKFVEFLDKNFEDYTYFGYDLSEKMISEAIKLYHDNKKSMFKEMDSLEEVEPADYIIASEIFNVNFDYADPLFIFDFCKRNFSKHVALHHDNGLY